jgi:endonuclease III
LEYGPEENLISDIDRSTKVSDMEIQLVKEKGKGEVRVRKTVLDSLVGTILSQNTTDNNSRRAFDSLKQAFPTWEEVGGRL